MAGYLQVVYKESVRRDYRFDRTRIRRRGGKERIPETRGQLLYEWHHLKAKLRKRSPKYFFKIRQITDPEPHPLFKIIPGKVRDWEKRTRHNASVMRVD
jgi:hypothetical protein